MSKFTKIFGGIALVLLLGIGAYLVFLYSSPVEVSKESKGSGLTTLTTSSCGDKKLCTDILEEIYFQRTLHRMSHQKVKAENKWGNIEITDEQIDSMIDELNKYDYKHEKYYRKVLKAWKKGDFSNAVEVHNDLWETDEGTTGKAERLLTEEEEQEYINEHFRQEAEN